MKICSTSQNNPGWLQEEFLAIQLFVQPLLVTLTERKKVRGQSGLEVQLCLNRIKLSEWLFLVYTLSSVLSAASQSILIKAFIADGERSPQNIGTGKHTSQKQVLKEKEIKIGTRICSVCSCCWKLGTLQSAAHISYFFALGDRYDSNCHARICIAVSPCDLHLCRFAHISCSSPACQLSSLLPHTHPLL